jgi:hypothetical protein
MGGWLGPEWYGGGYGDGHGEGYGSGCGEGEPYGDGAAMVKDTVVGVVKESHTVMERQW